MQSAIQWGTLSCGFQLFTFQRAACWLTWILRSTYSERVGEASTNLTVGQPRLTSGERSISEDPAPRQADQVKTF